MSGRSRARGGAIVAVLASVIVGGIPGGMPAPWGHPAAPSIGRSAPALPAAMRPSCLGARDLLVDGTRLTLSGTHTFERVCIEHGATLATTATLTLRAGALYVDASSRITAAGADGSLWGADCMDGVQPQPGDADGKAAGALTILSRETIVQGPISADGGRGATPSHVCGSRAGAGGPGGHVVVQTLSLSLTAPISATGGAGAAPSGDASADTNYGPPARGGAGGTIRLLVAGGAPASLRAVLHVGGGAGGAGERRTAPGGASGSVAVGPLPAALQAALPPLPAPLVRILGTPPVRLPFQSPAIFGAGMACRAGDLDVGAHARLVLGGSHTYPHVCIHDGGVLRVRRSLVLRAGTILVGAGSLVTADGTMTATGGISPTGRYEDAGPGGSPRAMPHVGMPGADGDGGHYAGNYADISIVPRGGAAGGAIALIARRILIAGALSARGANGAAASQHDVCWRRCGNGSTGAGGGSGGGVLVRAGELELSGTIAITGGRGGAGYPGVTNQGCAGCDASATDGGAHGGPGLALLLVDILRAPDGPLPVAGGPAFVGHSRPADPAPPPATGPAGHGSAGAARSAPWQRTWARSVRRGSGTVR